MRDFSKFVSVKKVKLQCFPGATSKQLLHYLDVNLQDKNTESVILHNGVNDVRVSVKTFENIHDKMVSLCSKLNFQYIDNRNINANHLFIWWNQGILS